MTCVMTIANGFMLQRAIKQLCAVSLLFALLAGTAGFAQPAPKPLSSQEADALAIAAATGDRTAIARLLDLGHRGDPAAQARIGWLYYRGEVVRQDFAAAFEWIARAAKGGDPEAMNALGHLHQEGLGTAKDRAAARSWYAKAAEMGLAPAANNLGLLLLDGE